MQNLKLLREVPIDAYKKQQTGNLVTGQNTINVPAKTLFVKGIQVYDSTSAATGANTFLEKKMKHIYKNIFLQQKPQQDNLNIMLCLVELLETTDTNSGRIMFAPVPDSTYKFKIHFNKAIPDGF